MRRYIDQQQPKSQASTFAMGSIVTQTIWGGDDAVAQAHRAIVELEDQISWRLEGDIARINTGSDDTAVSPEVFRILATAMELCERSDGAFNPVMGAATQLWSFDSDPALPDEDELSAALARSQPGALSLDEKQGTARLTDGAAIDLGAMGKGAALDAAVATYERAEVDAAVIAVGGSVGLYGRKPGGDWRVSVRDPEGTGSLGVLELSAGYVSTSGSYEKYFVQDGVTYHHILDPHTGYPAEPGLVSVTVYLPADCGLEDPGALSDGLATACFVLGRERSLALLDSYGAQAVFIDQERGVWVTDGLKFTLSADGYQLQEG